MCRVHGFRTCTKKQKKSNKEKRKFVQNVQDLRVRGEFTSIK